MPVLTSSVDTASPDFSANAAAMQALVEHLDLLAKHDIASLRKLCRVNDEDITDMISEIRRLDPKPGLKFGSAKAQSVVPDVYVRPGPDGGWHVELNSDTLPKVLVNQTYYSQLSKTIRKDGFFDWALVYDIIKLS